jgi:hypothetical protein
MTDNAYDGEASSPWAQKGFIAAAVVVALLVVLGVVVVLTRPSGGDDRAAQQPPAASTSGASPTTSTSPAGDSVCGLPTGDQTVPTTAPAGTRWELVGTMATPTAPKAHGPGRVEDGLRSCFAHTPTGALYSAVNIVAVTTIPELREPLVSKLGATGAGRDAALKLLATPNTEPDSTNRIQLSGFAFLNYGKDAALVDLALRISTTAGKTGFVHFPASLRWEAGDWKVVIPPNGDPAKSVQGIPDLTGYIIWGGA